jgi:hypothetical protein
MVEITDVGNLGDPGHGEGDLPDVARRSLEGSSPSHAPPERARDQPREARPHSVAVTGAHRIHILIAGGGRVRETVSEDLSDVTRAIADAGDHEIWVDIETEDLAKALAPFDAKVTDDQYLVTNQEKRSVLGWPYLVRDQMEPRYCVLVAAGESAIVTVHLPDIPHDPITDARKVIDSAVHARTDGGFRPLGSFREFAFLQMAESCTTEMMGALQKQSKRLGQVYDNVYGEEFRPAAIQTALFDIHRFLEQTLSPTLFLVREFFFRLERGGARFLPLDGVKGDLARLAEELDRLMGLKGNMETTIELVSNAVRAKLSEQTLQASWQLQLAVEVLVRVSLLLMIPTAVFSLWPLMPMPADVPFEFLGIRTYSIVWNILTAIVLTVGAQVLLGRMYKRAFKLDELRGGAGGGGTKPPTRKGP